MRIRLKRITNSTIDECIRSIVVFKKNDRPIVDAYFCPVSRGTFECTTIDMLQIVFGLYCDYQI